MKEAHQPAYSFRVSIGVPSTSFYLEYVSLLAHPPTMAHICRSLHQQYHPTLCKFMSWKHPGQLFGKDHVFSAESLAAITPEDLVG
jgi:hypothetical protein